MSEQTKIEWTDSTLNFWEGCTKVSVGCTNCYAETRDKRFTGGAHWGPGAPRRKSQSAVKDALRLNKKPWVCDECGNGLREPGWCGNCRTQDSHRRRIFSLSLGDWLDPEVPVEWLAEMLWTIDACRDVEWILCTKRPERWSERIQAAVMVTEDADESLVGRWLEGEHPHNVTLLASVENQEQADRRIPALLRIPAARRGLSLEPLLGPVDIFAESVEWFYEGWENEGRSPKKRGIDWLIIGGESGPKARPCDIEWIRSLVKQGQTAGVATFVKQLGSRSIDGSTESKLLDCIGMSLFRDRKGGNPNEWPADLRVQQYPEGLR